MSGKDEWWKMWWMLKSYAEKQFPEDVDFFLTQKQTRLFNTFFLRWVIYQHSVSLIYIILRSTRDWLKKNWIWRKFPSENCSFSCCFLWKRCSTQNTTTSSKATKPLNNLSNKNWWRDEQVVANAVASSSLPS